VSLEREQDRRHQVAQRFANASAGFDYQMLFFFQRLCDPRCHLLLLWTELKVLCFGERAVLGKKAANSLNEFAAQIVFQRDHDEWRQMSKDECRMSKEARSPNNEKVTSQSLRI
jgi:hypothetical protein